QDDEVLAARRRKWGPRFAVARRGKTKVGAEVKVTRRVADGTMAAAVLGRERCRKQQLIVDVEPRCAARAEQEAVLAGRQFPDRRRTQQERVAPVAADAGIDILVRHLEEAESILTIHLRGRGGWIGPGVAGRQAIFAKLHKDLAAW